MERRRIPSALVRSQLMVVGLTLGSLATGSEPRLNQLQVIGSHNSYHVAPQGAIRELIVSKNAQRAQGLDYTHPPLAEQFSRLGIRQVELDLYADPKGGLFASPAARSTVRALGKDAGVDPDLGGVLRKPGMKVLHVPDVDYRTTAPTFVDALDADPRLVTGQSATRSDLDPGGAEGRRASRPSSETGSVW